MSEPNPDWISVTDDSPPGLTIASIELDLENVRSHRDLSDLFTGICCELNKQLTPHNLALHHSFDPVRCVNVINLNQAFVSQPSVREQWARSAKLLDECARLRTLVFELEQAVTRLRRELPLGD